MIINIDNLAHTLQTLLTQTIGEMADQANFFSRTREYSLTQFVHTILFGWIEQPNAPLDEFAPRLGVSSQAIHQRFQQAQDFAHLLLQAHLNQLVQADPTHQPLLDRFDAVIVEDSTTITLPADLAADWPGCGNRTEHGKAAIKINLRYELKSGQLQQVDLYPGREHDAPHAARAEQLPQKSLHLADLGYFDTRRWAEFDTAKSPRYFISRANPQVMLLRCTGWQSLPEFLASQPAWVDRIDREVVINRQTFLPVRLVALRCPTEVANRRRQRARRTAKRKGKTISRATQVMCEWTVLITNVLAETLSSEEVWVLYRLRWQVELWIKRAKQFHGLEVSHGRRGPRVLGELLFKLTGALIAHWGVLLGGGPLGKRSSWQCWRQVQHYLIMLGWVLQQTGQIAREILTEILQVMGHLREPPKRRDRPGSRDLLNDPERASQDA